MGSQCTQFGAKTRDHSDTWRTIQLPANNLLRLSGPRAGQKMVGKRDEAGVQMFGVVLEMGRLRSEVSEGKDRGEGMED